MGLNIKAYKNLKVVQNSNSALDEEFFSPGISIMWTEKYFPGRSEGIDINSMYSWEEIYSFRAGSYSGYNYWRDQLSDLSSKLEKSSFLELIEFADNEGIIGPVVSTKLFNDFKNNIDKAKKHFDECGFNKYLEWLKAFSFAKEKGAIEFH